ncbi:MAG: transposase [Lentisphaeria bacterium]|nr:transposase [Lentisphaeria bacterium]
MPSDRDPQSEREQIEAKDAEIVALKKLVDRLSRQVYGRVMPGLYALPSEEKACPSDAAGPRPDAVSERPPRGLHESAAPYHASEPVFVPPDFPSDELILELPPAESGAMAVVAFESAEAIAARPAVVLRTVRRAMYAANDGSGMSAAAPRPALFPDPSGGGRMFDASFVAYAADLRLAGMTFRTISDRLKTESGLVVPEPALRGLVLAAAETIGPVCSAMVARTLPDWMNLRRMFGEAKAGGDWLADEFLQRIHALGELEDHARIRAERLGGSPEDLYRERRAVRTESARIAAKIFERCRETLPAQDPRSILSEALSFALEHETSLSEFLHDPRLELFRANPETPVADPFAALAICADECRSRSVSFRVWLEKTLVRLNRPNPPPPASLFPR